MRYVSPPTHPPTHPPTFFPTHSNRLLFFYPLMYSTYSSSFKPPTHPPTHLPKQQAAEHFAIFCITGIEEEGQQQEDEDEGEDVVNTEFSLGKSLPHPPTHPATHLPNRLFLLYSHGVQQLIQTASSSTHPPT